MIKQVLVLLLAAASAAAHSHHTPEQFKQVSDAFPSFEEVIESRPDFKKGYADFLNSLAEGKPRAAAPGHKVNKAVHGKAAKAKKTAHEKALKAKNGAHEHADEKKAAHGKALKAKKAHEKTGKASKPARPDRGGEG